jgi:superfamily II RNA helicase
MSEYYEHNTGEYIGEHPPMYCKFDYQLSDFQLHAFKAISDGNNILVTAHTGSGKTAIAQNALAKGINENKKVVYIGPIKALINQIANQLSKLFPNIDIGVLSGDIKKNPNSDIIVMVAEILKNSLMRKENTIYEWNFNPDEISVVVIDEIHFINNPDRGHVFEDILIRLDPKIQLIMLSATIDGAEQFAQWIGTLKKKKCHLISTEKRIVPLQHGIFIDHDFIEKIKFKSEIQKSQAISELMMAKKFSKENFCATDLDKEKSKNSIISPINYFLYGDSDWKNYSWANCYKLINQYYSTNSFSLDIFHRCINYLYEHNLTPCTVFLLSKKLIEKYAKSISSIFITEDESFEIKKIWHNYLYKFTPLYEHLEEWKTLYNLIISYGCAYHHSDVLPVLKELIEILYSKGLIKILIASESVAVGVNFPTKCVVFTQMTKMKQLLKSDEYKQMSGRSGRRGLDTKGIVLILPHKDFITEQDAKNIILSKSSKILSKFIIDPVYVLKHYAYELDLTDYKDSLFNYQNQDNNVIKLKNELDKIKHDNNLTDELVNEAMEIINKYDFGIKLAPKTEKKYKESLDKLKIKDVNIIKKYNNLRNELNKTTNKYEIQISLITNYLIELNYLGENNKLTKNGRIIAEINDCNGFLLAYIYNNLEKIEFNEIVAVLSILIHDNKQDEEIYPNDLNCTNICKHIIYDIQQSIEIFSKLENELNNKLPYPCWQNWNINLSMFDSVKLWASGENHIDCTYFGNFIKLILRVNNVLKNIDVIAKIFNDINIINKLNGFEEKLIRNAVTVESLYI